MERGEALGDGVRLDDSTLTQADIGLSAVEKARRGGFGVTKQKDASFKQKCCSRPRREGS